jgi:hypothetical protein
MPRRHIEEADFFEDEVEALRRESAEQKEQIAALSEALLLAKNRLSSRIYILGAAIVIMGRIVLRLYEPRAMCIYLDVLFGVGVAALLFLWSQKAISELGVAMVADVVLIANCIFAFAFYRNGIYVLAAGLLVSSTRTLEVLTTNGLNFLERIYDKGRNDKAGH